MQVVVGVIHIMFENRGFSPAGPSEGTFEETDTQKCFLSSACFGDDQYLYFVQPTESIERPFCRVAIPKTKQSNSAGSSGSFCRSALCGFASFPF